MYTRKGDPLDCVLPPASEVGNMRCSRAGLLVAVMGSSPDCWAQFWSIGAAGGFGFCKDASITHATGAGRAGFGPRVALGVAAAYFGGELRYTFRDGDSELKSGGREANMDAAAHAMHYDFLIYATSRRARLRPFGALEFRYAGDTVFVRLSFAFRES